MYFFCQLTKIRSNEVIKDEKSGKSKNYDVLTFSPFYVTDKGIKISTGEKSKDKWVLHDSELFTKLSKMNLSLGSYYDVEITWEAKIIDIHNLKTK
ncbi:hypothetical protein [Spiroplasma ixodetis]|uniref:Uncharacterized protein n=1 Tax=Spiroplasma ixodetis TaxID=2141 RepID=A0ABN6SWF6_9MOLU|nr:hypothetical protein [Spiroplasma ixodetis]BDT02782.1 hypothetical protein SHM_04280 [Spiroplasma ixodetis]